MPPKSGTVYIGENEAPKASKDRIVPKTASPQITDLDKLINKSSMVIFETKTGSAFGLFQTKLTICPNRITITNKGLFTKEEYPIPIESVIGARIYTHFFSASLYLETFGYEKPKPIRPLSIKDARLARRFILALIECKKNNVDINSYSLQELREKLKQIGIVREGFEKAREHIL